MVRHTPDLRKCRDGLLGLLRNGLGCSAKAGENRGNNSLRLLYKREQQMHRLQLLVAESSGELLDRLQSFLRFYSESIKTCGHNKISTFVIDLEIQQG